MGDMNPIFDVYAMDEAKAKARAEGYDAGQRSMRERAAEHIRKIPRREAFLIDISIGMRALPIIEEPKA